AWLVDVQAHSLSSSEASTLQGATTNLQVAEGGQLLLMRVNQGGSISGTVFRDADGNGADNAGDADGAGFVLFLDMNNNQRLDPGEVTARADAQGAFTFNALPSG